jgi:hypothetical protein
MHYSPMISTGYDEQVQKLALNEVILSLSVMQNNPSGEAHITIFFPRPHWANPNRSWLMNSNNNHAYLPYENPVGAARCAGNAFLPIGITETGVSDCYPIPPML